VVGLGGDVHDPPQVPVLGGEEPAGEVVLVPAGQDDDDRGAGGEAGGGDVGPPVPHVLPERLGVGFLAVLDRVVDDQQVGGAAGEATADADGQHPALVAVEGPVVDGAVVGGDRQAQLGWCGDAVADRAAVAGGEALPVGGDDDPGVGVLGEPPGGEVAGDPGGLPLLRGHGDDQPAVGGVGDVDEGLRR
jgi:hypothetical protein